jgi:hypothetical protein
MDFLLKYFYYAIIFYSLIVILLNFQLWPYFPKALRALMARDFKEVRLTMAICIVMTTKFLIDKITSVEIRQYMVDQRTKHLKLIDFSYSLTMKENSIQNNLDDWAKESTLMDAIYSIYIMILYHFRPNVLWDKIKEAVMYLR